MKSWAQFFRERHDSRPKKFRAYSKEYSELEQIVSCFKKIGVNSKEILETEKMLRDPDKEIQELAGDEIIELKKKERD